MYEFWADTNIMFITYAKINEKKYAWSVMCLGLWLGWIVPTAFLMQVDDSKGRIIQMWTRREATDPSGKRNKCCGNNNSSTPNLFDLFTEALWILKLIMFSKYGTGFVIY